MMVVTELDKHVGSKAEKGSSRTHSNKFHNNVLHATTTEIHIKSYYPNRPGPGNFLIFKKTLYFTDLHHNDPRYPLD